MKNQSRKILGLGILIAGIILLMSAAPKPSANNMITMNPLVRDSTEELKAQALKILQTRCNVCHKKKNPFMLFKEKNMEKRAEKINKQVFITGRMPKGDTPLTQEEYDTLKNWINSLNLN